MRFSLGILRSDQTHRVSEWFWYKPRCMLLAKLILVQQRQEDVDAAEVNIDKRTKDSRMRSFQLGTRRIRLSTGPSAATGRLVLVLEKGFEFLSIDPDPYIVVRRPLRLAVMRARSIEEGGFGVQITDEAFATACRIGRFGRRPLGVMSGRSAITGVRLAFMIAVCEVNASFLSSQG